MSGIFPKILNINPITGDALKALLHYRTFKKKYNFLKESQWWSKEKIEEYQLNQLNKLIHHAYENVPYYTNLFDNLGLKPRDIQDFKDLKKLPYLTKQIVKENIIDLKAKNYSRRKFEFITSGGSTGKPLVMYVQKGVAEAEYLAYNQIFLDRANCHFKNKRVHLFGFDNICKHHVLGRIMTLSSFYMSGEKLPFYINMIRKYKPIFIIAFPSAITSLAKFMYKKNIKSFSSIKTVICGGETIYEWQRKLVEKTFQCRVHNIYNLAELVVFATSCENSNNYHVYPEYGITELINKDGKIVSKNGKKGEIIGTGFTNFIFPLIRYKTEDIGIFSNQRCKCGRNHLMLENIIGRTQQFILSKSQRLFHLTGIYGLVAHCTQNVKECQFYQEKEGEIILRIVKENNYTNRDEELIKKSFHRKFREEIDLTISYVDNIPKTSRGKHQFLIQKLPIESYKNDEISKSLY